MVRDDTYKYLCIVIDSKHNWNENTESMMMKVNPRMYCLKKFKKFGVNADLLLMFCNAVIISIIYFGAACWGGNVSKHDQGRLDKVKHIASHIFGRQTTSSLCIEGKCYLKLVRYSKTTHTPSVSNFIHGSVTEAAVFYSLTSRQTATSILFYPQPFLFFTLN